jgi:hypothetical protein
MIDATFTLLHAKKGLRDGTMRKAHKKKKGARLCILFVVHGVHNKQNESNNDTQNDESKK